MDPSSSDQAQPTFAAIDFETSDTSRDSACALAIVRVRGGRIERQSAFLIRPPRSHFVFTYLHGISWEDVADKPTFGELWPRIADELAGADFLAAHNAGFDRSVLLSCCRQAGCDLPPFAFQCTVRVARRAWGIRPTTLPAVCRYLGIELRHHDPHSDAAACARIVLAALQDGHTLPPFLGHPRRPRA